MGVKKLLAIIAGVVTSLAGFVAMFLLGKKVGYNEPLAKREVIKDGMEKAREEKNMKLKVLTLIVLLNSLLMLPLIAQESMSIKNHSDLMQIEPSATYSGDLVLELLEAVKNTAERD